MTPSFRIAALYRFAHLDAPQRLADALRATCTEHSVVGTLILAEEGINGTIAGPESGVEHVLASIRSVPGLEQLETKDATSTAPPFRRLKVVVKPEIVTMGAEGADPRLRVGTYVPPAKWNALLDEPDIVIVDTRNHYESQIGTFTGSTLPNTETFRDFPAWFDRHRDELASASKVAMFCTGGIRCERATAYLLEQGVEEVYHLEGGILAYLEQIPAEESRWQGACFVFDERVSVEHGLTEGDHGICASCGHPVLPAETCPACGAVASEA